MTKNFDPNDVDSVIKFTEQLIESDSSKVDGFILLINLRKTIDVLKDIKDGDFEIRHLSKLLGLILNISIFSHIPHIKFEIIQQDLHLILSKIIVFQLEKLELEHEILVNVYGTLNNLTDGSIKIARKNLERGIYKLTTILLNRMSTDISFIINTEPEFSLYNRLIIFLLYNAQYKEIRDLLIKTDLVETLTNELNRLKTLKEDSNVKIKYVTLNITRSLVYLLDNSELDTSPLSMDIVDQCINVLNECIDNSKTNTKSFNKTKYYISYSTVIASTCLFAGGYIKSIRKVAANDAIQQKLYDKHILSVIEELLTNGNEDEVHICLDLLSVLCVNENVLSYLRNNQNIQNIVKNINERTEYDDTKDLCGQILKITVEIDDEQVCIEQRSEEKGDIIVNYTNKSKQ